MPSSQARQQDGNSFSVPLPSHHSNNNNNNNAIGLYSAHLASRTTPRASTTANSSAAPNMTSALSPLLLSSSLSSATAMFREVYTVCNAIDSKHSNGYPSTLPRGEVFGSYTDMRSPCITYTLLPPSTTTFVEADGRELACRFRVVRSLLDAVNIASSSTAAANGGATTSATGVEGEKHQSVPPPKSPNVPAAAAASSPTTTPASLIIPGDLVTKVKSVDGVLDYLQISRPQPECASSPAPPELASAGSGSGGPVALVCITTFQHTTLYCINVSAPSAPTTSASSEARSSSSLAPAELIQTWTIPAIGRRCTANLVTLVGCVVGTNHHAATVSGGGGGGGSPFMGPPSPSSVSFPPSSAGNHVTGGNSGVFGGSTSNAVVDVTVGCEPMIILGFERGDICFCSVAQERIVRRINSSFQPGSPSSSSNGTPRSPPSSPGSQLISAACTCIVEIQSSTQCTLRHALNRKQKMYNTAKNNTSSPPQTFTPSATSNADGGEPGGQQPAPPPPLSPGDSSHGGSSAPLTIDGGSESIYAAGFDDGSILIITVTVHPSADALSCGVQLRHHVNFGRRPIHAIEPSLPPFFVSLWAAHDAKLAARRGQHVGGAARASSSSLLMLASVSSSRSSSITDPPPHPTITPPTTNTASNETTLSSLYLIFGADDTDDVEEIVATPPPPGAATAAGDGSSLTHHHTETHHVVGIMSPVYAAITAECGTIHVVQLPLFEKRTSVSNRCDHLACGDYHSVKWVGRQHPEFLIAGGEGDEIDVFAMGNMHHGQFRRVGAPTNAWGGGGDGGGGGGGSTTSTSLLSNMFFNTSQTTPAAAAAPTSTRDPSSSSGGGRPSSSSLNTSQSLSMRLVQRLLFHRSWINSLCVIPLSGLGGGGSSFDDILITAVSLDDTISVWHVPSPPTPSSAGSAMLQSSAAAAAAVAFTPSRPSKRPSMSSSSASPAAAQYDAVTPPPSGRRPPPLMNPALPCSPGGGDDVSPSSQQQVAANHHHSNHNSAATPLASVSDEPVQVVQRCHDDDMVVTSAAVNAGRFGVLWVTLCLRGRVRFWKVDAIPFAAVGGAGRTTATSEL